MIVVGIDVSKATVDVAMLDGDACPVIDRMPNTETAIATLVSRLTTAKIALVALEATGAYHARLVTALVAAKLEVTLLNPAQIRAFRQTVAGRNKTDRTDAVLIARYARLHQTDLARVDVRDARQERLRELVRYRATVLARRIALDNQHAAARLQQEETIIPLLDADRTHARAQLKVVEQAIRDVLAQIPEAAILEEITGVGWVTVAVVLAELPVAVWGNAKAAAAYAGVHPAQTQSGTRQTSRMSKQGNPRLRQALYCAAMPCVRWNADLATVYHRHLGRGRPKMVALGAVMHTLLRRMMGTLRAWYATTGTIPLAPRTEDTAIAA